MNTQDVLFAKANSGASMLGGVAPASKKSIGDARNESVRALVRELLARRFQGNNSAMAKALGVSAGFLSEFLAGTRGAGMSLLDVLRKMTGYSLDDIVSGDAVRLLADGVDLPRGVRVEYDDRYPNRAAVLVTLGDAYDSEAVRVVRSLELHHPNDPPKSWWVQRLQDEDRRVRQEREYPEIATARAQASRDTSLAAIAEHAARVRAAGGRTAEDDELGPAPVGSVEWQEQQDAARPTRRSRPPPKKGPKD